jgi:hypothetical protein
MILLLSAVNKANDCAHALEQATHEPVELCTTIEAGIRKLQQQEFSAVVLDELVLASEVDQGEAIYKHLGSTLLVSTNFAITGIDRVVAEFRSVSQRRNRDLLAAKKHAAQVLVQELKDTLTALLLSCEIALRVPQLPLEAEQKMQEVEALAKQLSKNLAAA